MVSKEIDKDIKRNKTVEFTCIRCGKTKIVPKYLIWKWKWGIDGKRFCGENCFMDELAHCCVCGKTTNRNRFDFQHMRSQYCSKECKEKDENRIALRVGRVAACEICGTVFPNYYNNRKYCSEECRNIAKKQYKDKKRNS